MSRTLEECMEWMDIRAKFVQEHQTMMLDMFDAWGHLEWIDVMVKLEALIQFIRENYKVFPNRDQHIEQYKFLLDVARERFLDGTE